MLTVLVSEIGGGVQVLTHRGFQKEPTAVNRFCSVKHKAQHGTGKGISCKICKRALQKGPMQRSGFRFQLGMLPFS